MEKEFALYPEAFELKQLGFDEDSFRYYNNDLKLSRLGLFYIYDNPSDFLCLAPTYSQAFRWFRKKYGYEIYISGTIFRASYVIGIPKEINMESVDGYPLVTSWDYIVDETGERKTYEEAELACMRKLIELVKNK